MSTSSGDDDFSSAASLSAGEASDGCDCDDCFLGISDIMSSALRGTPLVKKVRYAAASLLTPMISGREYSFGNDGNLTA